MNCRGKLAGILGLALLHGCAHTKLEEFCASEIPQMTAVLRGGEAEGLNRSLASADSTPGSTDETWEYWAEQSKQAVRDHNRWREAWAQEASARGALNDKTRWDEELTLQSNRWVWVYSFATRQKAKELSRELDRIRAAHGSISRKLCSP